jgi:dTDP-4-dehydrorhamnose 3,5-epimerase
VNIITTILPGVIEIEPDVYADKRGFFMETYQHIRYKDCGIDRTFVQDNLSFSFQGTLRGIHFQYPRPQAKLIQALEGEVFDAVVDIRRGSPHFGRWASAILSDQNKHQLYVPEGFAHGFCVLSERALVHYKCSEFYAPDCEAGILWSDPELNINWPVKTPVISEKDSRYIFLRDLPVDRLPVYEDNP